MDVSRILRFCEWTQYHFLVPKNPGTQVESKFQHHQEIKHGNGHSNFLVILKEITSKIISNVRGKCEIVIFTNKKGVCEYSFRNPQIKFLFYF